MRQIDPNRWPSGDIATLDTQRRFKVPKPILEALGWGGSAPPRHLLAEIVDNGHLRFWEAATAQPFLNSIETDLREAMEEAIENSYGDLAEYDAALRAFHDRFRPVTLRPSDGRIQLPSVLYVIIDPHSKTPPLYVEFGPKCFEVYAPHARIKRLRKFRNEIRMPNI